MVQSNARPQILQKIRGMAAAAFRNITFTKAWLPPDTPAADRLSGSLSRGKMPNRTQPGSLFFVDLAIEAGRARFSPLAHPLSFRKRRDQRPFHKKFLIVKGFAYFAHSFEDTAMNLPDSLHPVVMHNPQSAISRSLRLAWLQIACLIPVLAGSARASIAYGSINNFDTVNDTGSECHGFEIELEDCRSTDISYTYDYNHYDTPHDGLHHVEVADPAPTHLFFRLKKP